MKPRVVFIANVGTSDIEEFSRKKGKDKEFFNDTERYWKTHNFDITPTFLPKKLEYLQRKYSLSDSKIYLCTTRQEPPFKSDTYYAGELLRVKLSRMFDISEDNISVLVYRSDPREFGKLKDWYERDVLESVEVYLKEGYSLAISITGGTPQQTLALFFSSAIKYPTYLSEVLYIKEGEGEVVLIPNLFYEKFLEKHVKFLEEKGLFYSAHKLAVESGYFERKYEEKLYALNLFQNFAFPDFEKFVEEKTYLKSEVEEELQVLEQYKKFSNLRDIVRKTGELDKVKGQGYYLLYLSALEKILEDAKRKWEQGEYIDFLGRLMRIREGLLKFVIEWKDNVPVSFYYRESGISSQLKEWVKKYLTEKAVEGKNENPKEDDFLRRINSGLMEDEAVKKVYGFVSRTKSLKELRNHLILTHEFEGVSETLILNLARYRSIEELFSEVETCVKLLKKKLGEN